MPDNTPPSQNTLVSESDDFSDAMSDFFGGDQAREAVAPVLRVLAAEERPVELHLGQEGDERYLTTVLLHTPDNSAADELVRISPMGTITATELASQVHTGQEVSAFFRPVDVDQTEYNHFHTTFAGDDALQWPAVMEYASRRKHVRQLVEDPRWVRLSLWTGDARENSELTRTIPFATFDPTTVHRTSPCEQIEDVSVRGSGFYLHAEKVEHALLRGETVTLRLDLQDPNSKGYSTHLLVGAVVYRGPAPLPECEKVGVEFTALATPYTGIGETGTGAEFAPIPGDGLEEIRAWIASIAESEGASNLDSME